MCYSCPHCKSKSWCNHVPCRNWQITTETGRPRIQREASQLTLAPNVNDFGHVALFVKSKRSTNVVTFLRAVCGSVLEA